MQGLIRCSPTWNSYAGGHNFPTISKYMLSSKQRISPNSVIYSYNSSRSSPLGTNGHAKKTAALESTAGKRTRTASGKIIVNATRKISEWNIATAADDGYGRESWKRCLGAPRLWAAECRGKTDRSCPGHACTAQPHQCRKFCAAFTGACTRWCGKIYWGRPVRLLHTCTVGHCHSVSRSLTLDESGRLITVINVCVNSTLQ